MIVEKFHPNLLNNVKTLSCQDISCVVSSFNFTKTKQELQKLNIEFTPYSFTNSFFVKTNFESLKKISNLTSVEFLTKTEKVSTNIFNAKKVINLNNLTQNKFFGKNITVAFIDTGITPHLDFIFPKCRILHFKDLINNKNLPYDDNGHGTFVASVCGGSGVLNKKYSGVAPCINIVAIKALDKKGETDSNKILDAMQYVYEKVDELNIKIVCMSFGADSIGNNDPLQKGAMALWNKGIVVVAAAGNSGPEEKTIKSPGSCSKIITVGGLDSSNIEDLKVANFSSRGPTQTRFKPDLIAPSVDIVGANLNFDEPYIKMSGTSVATPIVAGIASILLEQNKNITPNRLKFILLNNCKSLKKDKNSEGFGYINF